VFPWNSTGAKAKQLPADAALKGALHVSVSTECANGGMAPGSWGRVFNDGRPLGLLTERTYSVALYEMTAAWAGILEATTSAPR